MAQVFEYNGRTVEFPDNTPKEVITSKLKELKQSGQLDEYIPYGKVPEEIDADKLIENQDWMRASSEVYNAVKRQPFDGSPEELAEWSREFMAYFNYNIAATGITAESLMKADQTQKEAFLYMMDTFDNTNMSWEGAGNAAVAIALDPTNLAGIGSLGLGKVAAMGAQKVGKQALLHELKKGLGRTGVVLGAESAALSYADDRMRQNIEVDAGRKEERDAMQSMIATGTGFAFGATLGVAGDYLATKFGRMTKTSGKAQTEELPPQPLGKDTAPVDETLVKTVDNSVEIVKDKAEEVAQGITKEAGVLKFGALELPVNERVLSRRNDTLAASLEFGEEVAKQMAKLNPEQAADLPAALGVDRLSLREVEELASSTLTARNNLSDELAKLIIKNNANPTPELKAEILRMGDRQAGIEMLDSLLRNSPAYMMRARQEQNTLLNDLTLDNVRKSLVDEKRPADEADVFNEFVRLHTEASQGYEQKQISREFDNAARESLNKGDLRGAMDKAVEKRVKLNSLSKIAQETEASWPSKVLEFAISNVFSPTTLQMNVLASSIKTVINPAVRALLNDPFELATRQHMMASYSAMRSSLGMAWRASKASFRLEQSLLTRDPNKYLENALAIKGRKGGWIRTYIRLTTAQDEFLSQINYTSYIAGRASSDAVIEAQKRGYTGEQLDAFVKKRTEAALKEAYKQADVEQALIPIVTKGKNLNLSGKALEDFVKAEIAKDPDALRVANTKDNELNKEAVTYLRDTLYKREFSGEGTASSLAKWFDEGMSTQPTLKLLIGQLFIRTPLRVFEEGMRITPAAQFLAPRFLSDIRGLNGPERMTRARGEAMASIAMASAVMTLYSEGRITGAGSNRDWRQDALQRDSAEQDPYTIVDEDGNSYSYRFFDPIATPMKTMVTGMELLDRLTIRKAQGEEIPDKAFQDVSNYIGITTIAFYKAFTDANLLAGLGGTADAIESAFDPEGRPSGFLRFIGEKMRLVTPSTVRKAELTLNPEDSMREPATVLQVAQAQLLDPWGIEAIKTPYAYDHMGRRKSLTNTGALWNVFSGATPEQRAKGRSENELFVDKELKRLQEITDLIIRIPTSHSSTNIDYRTVLTADGKETLYDRWNQLYNETLNVDAMAKILKAPLPDGTMKYKGPRVTTIQTMINSARDIAHAKLMSENPQLFDVDVRNQTQKALSEAGLFDADRKTNSKPVKDFLEEIQ